MKYGVGADFGFRPATEQEQAEAYVRKQRPHLMELTFGCEVTVNWGCPEPDEDHTCGAVLINKHEWKGWYEVTNFSLGTKKVTKDAMQEIIGHPLNLQDWLAVLVNHCEQINYIQLNGTNYITFMANRHPYKTLLFNLTTRQPNSPQDYANFNQIVNN